VSHDLDHVLFVVSVIHMPLLLWQMTFHVMIYSTFLTKHRLRRDGRTNRHRAVVFTSLALRRAIKILLAYGNVIWMNGWF